MAKKKASKQAAGGAAAASSSADDLRWVEADKGYAVALDDGKLSCRNAAGKRLASVPKWLKDSDAGQNLTALRDWLEEHQQNCQDTIEAWILRSLPVPAAVLAAVWPDAAWRRGLVNLVVGALQDGQLQQDQTGFLRDVDAGKGVGIVDLDGETQWLTSETVALPHPILLAELNDFRDLAAELNFTQQTDQLFRQTWTANREQLEHSVISDFENGKFEQLNHALGLCRRLGYRVRGGNACCTVWEQGVRTEGRFWVGADYPEGETWTGQLVWVDARERSVPIKSVGPVAFSEGMRMAAAIYAKRVVEKDDDEAD